MNCDDKHNAMLGEIKVQLAEGFHGIDKRLQSLEEAQQRRAGRWRLSWSSLIAPLILIVITALITMAAK
jgi:hypothetical protein